MCKVAASIYLEKILKADDGLSVILQSATISAGTVFPTMIYSLTEWNRMSGEGPFVGWSWLTGMLVLQILVKNWMSDVIVKQFSAVVKYVIFAFAVAGTYFIQRALYQEGLTLQPMLIITILMHGVYCFA